MPDWRTTDFGFELVWPYGPRFSRSAESVDVNTSRFTFARCIAASSARAVHVDRPASPSRSRRWRVRECTTTSQPATARSSDAASVMSPFTTVRRRAGA